MRTPQQDEPSIAEQAARWIGALERGAEQEHAAFSRWLRASPQHMREFLLQTALDKAITTLDLAEFDVESLLARAEGNVVRLAAEGKTRDECPQNSAATSERQAKKTRRPPLRGWWGRMGLAAAVLAALGGGWATLGPGSWRGYASAVGEQRMFELADGSVVELNPGSQLRVRLTARARDVQLLAGEAVFRVVGDSARPFRVRSGDTVVTAVGTRFAVLRRASSVTVSVIEGRVEVSNAKMAAALAPFRERQPEKEQERILDAGDMVKILKDGKAIDRDIPDTPQMYDWHEHQLTFSGDTLAEISEDFNRYNRAPQIRIEGEKLRSRQLSGVFDADDPQSLVDYLARTEQLAVERSPEVIVIREQ